MVLTNYILIYEKLYKKPCYGFAGGNVPISVIFLQFHWYMYIYILSNNLIYVYLWYIILYGPTNRLHIDLSQIRRQTVIWTQKKPSSLVLGQILVSRSRRMNAPVSCSMVGIVWTVTYVTVHTTWLTPKEPKIDMSISPLKRLSTRWFKYTRFNVAILIMMRRPNKSHLVKMRCYWWLKIRREDRGVPSVQADVNRNVKCREP